MKQNNRGTSEVSRVLGRGFQLAHQQIDFLLDKVSAKDSFLFIIEWHKFSQEELLNSEHHQKIYAITGKIGDDVKNWHSSNNLNSDDYSAYDEHRHQVELRLESVNHQIQTRQPTWWERIGDALTRFVIEVMARMPIVREVFQLPAFKKVLAMLPMPAFFKRILQLEASSGAHPPESKR